MIPIPPLADIGITRFTPITMHQGSTMNESENIPSTKPHASPRSDSHLKNVQLRMPWELHQRLIERLVAFNQRTGMNLSLSNLIVQTLEEYGMVQLERAEKVYEKYRKQTIKPAPVHETSLPPPMLRP